MFKDNHIVHLYDEVLAEVLPIARNLSIFDDFCPHEEPGHFEKLEHILFVDADAGVTDTDFQ